MRVGRWEPTIGLEVHVQLATASKLFCRCAAVFGGEPNTRTCAVCLGHPGVLPVCNEQALVLGARAALALGMTVQAESKFDRKNYFYPDLPKGYQISQFDEPLARDGALPLPGGGEAGIERLHLEEDAGKAVHDRGDFGLVDFNRAGTPLAEIVGRPDLESPEDAKAYLEVLKERLIWAGVSDCDMEKGNLRVDVNVSLALPGARATGTRVEVKNLNSFVAVGIALEHEFARQAAILDTGGAVAPETRHWDDETASTRSMRSKEEALDYRYFPDPDLPRLVLEPAWIEAQRAALPASAAVRRRRYREELGLGEHDARVLTGEPAIANCFDALLAAGTPAKAAANALANEVLARVPAAELAASPLDPDFLAAALALLEAGRTNRNGLRALIDARLGGAAAAPETLLAELGLEMRADAGELAAACEKAMAALPQAVAAVRAGKDKALGALLGRVMQETGGAADPAAVRALLIERIGGGDAPAR
ncbi:MAG TPA: Asp-tRNA(Asn)/Glu-tRNA(Gln) amidotransferase subunit GatB [Planctomycetota bacterium]